MNKQALGVGGFLLGLGVGYLALREFNISINLLAWVVISFGLIIVISGLLSWLIPNFPFGNIIGGAAGGVLIALLLTQGIGLIQGIGGFNPNLPYTTTETKNYVGPSPQGVIYLRIGGINGPISVSTWEKKEYSIEARITARGATQSEADANLAKLNKDLSKVDASESQRLTLVYVSPTLINNPYLTTIEVKLPSAAILNLEITTSNGQVNLSNIRGDSISINTSNGAVTLTNVIADSLNCHTSNAQVTGNFESKDTVISTSNGRISINVASTMSGLYDISTSNAAVNVVVSPNAAFKIEVNTSNSDIVINLPNLKYSRDQRTSKVSETIGYDLAAIKIELDITTSNGKVSIDKSTMGF